MHTPLERPVVRGGLRSLLFVLLSVALALGCGLVFGLVMDGMLLLGAGMDGDAVVPSFTLWLVLLVPALGCVLAYGACMVRAWRRGARLVLEQAGAEKVSALEMQVLRDVVEELALAAAVRPPAVAAIKSAALNALIAGSREHATIAATDGLLKTLTRAELEAVVAHELAHVINGDLDLCTFLAANTAIVTRFTGVLGLTAAVMQVLVSIAGRAAERERVYAADDAAVHLTRDPLALIKALEKVRESAPSGRLGKQPSIAPLCFVDPSSADSGTPPRPSTLPSVEDRLARLRWFMHPDGPRSPVTGENETDPPAAAERERDGAVL